MVIKYSTIDNSTIQVKRRTFEGKNEHALTSKYMPSYKYWYSFKTVEGVEHKDCVRTKQDAINAIEAYRAKEGQIL